MSMMWRFFAFACAALLGVMLYDCIFVAPTTGRIAALVACIAGIWSSHMLADATRETR